MKYATLKKRSIVFCHDLVMIVLAWYAAYWLRFNLGEVPADKLQQAEIILPMLMVIQVGFYWIFGLYRGIWRFASLPDLMRIVKAVVTAVILTIVILFLDKRLIQVPRSIFPLYGLLLIMFLGGSRFLYRWSKDKGKRHGKRVLIVGAGQAGEGIARDLKRDVNREYHAVAFVDDRVSKEGQEIQGIRVVGTTRVIPAIVKRYQIDLIIIAMPSARSADMRRIVEYCESTGVPFRTLPGLDHLASGNVKIDALREVSLEDLLGRDPVSLDWQDIRRGIEERTVMVSGGGGSIGSELCRQVARLAPKKLIVIEQNEYNLYSLKMEISQKFPEIDFMGYLVDVTDRVAVREVMCQNRIDVVFHAAAYKHVPMLESQLRVAIHNNTLGTQILAEEAVATKVKKFVLISTDKAVNPSNVMGATKRAAEIFIQNYNAHSDTKFITVRFGNVLGSAGSVVPLFRKQIESGGPVTVTHPEITRFFMTIPEATQLILQATVMGSGGEIFVLDMGDPIKIRYLAEQMILLAGLTLGEDIEIQYTGLRPGEKLYEELFHESEALKKTAHEKILQASYRERDWPKLLETLKEMKQACDENKESKLWHLLLLLVPEYSRAAIIELVGNNQPTLVPEEI
ncbi:MAG TPA: nucleoside-diphosphate sugar epimerase/dehydratase [Gammaproteobacteria bacterium]|nr:nucleoside-diphosphate sugar epimerase/dehydratase [Gammaproteobacteria bacterium]